MSKTPLKIVKITSIETPIDSWLFESSINISVPKQNPNESTATKHLEVVKLEQSEIDPWMIKSSFDLSVPTQNPLAVATINEPTAVKHLEVVKLEQSEIDPWMIKSSFDLSVPNPLIVKKIEQSDITSSDKDWLFKSSIGTGAPRENPLTVANINGATIKESTVARKLAQPKVKSMPQNFSDEDLFKSSFNQELPAKNQLAEKDNSTKKPLKVIKISPNDSSYDWVHESLVPESEAEPVITHHLVLAELFAEVNANKDSNNNNTNASLAGELTEDDF